MIDFNHSAYKTLCSIKKRIPWKVTLREKLIAHRKHQCPGWKGHDIPRREIVFNRHIGVTYRYGHLAYTLYWRLHPQK